METQLQKSLQDDLARHIAGQVKGPQQNEKSSTTNDTKHLFFQANLVLRATESNTSLVMRFEQLA